MEGKNNQPCGYVTIDGVQAELNLRGGIQCREGMASDIQLLFRKVNDLLSGSSMFKIGEQSVMKLTQQELDALPDKTKRFGCDASYNIYLKTKNQVSQVKVNPNVYSYRSAGGHIHLGTSGEDL